MSSWRKNACGRYWSNYYEARFAREPLISVLRWRHCDRCPGWVGDTHPAIGKFRRWYKLGEARKAWRLYWRLKGGMDVK